MLCRSMSTNPGMPAMPGMPRMPAPPQCFRYFSKCTTSACANIETPQKPHTIRCQKCWYFHCCSPACERYAEMFNQHQCFFTPPDKVALIKSETELHLKQNSSADQQVVNEGKRCIFCRTKKENISSELMRCGSCQSVRIEAENANNGIGCSENTRLSARTNSSSFRFEQGMAISTQLPRERGIIDTYKFSLDFPNAQAPPRQYQKFQLAVEAVVTEQDPESSPTLSPSIDFFGEGHPQRHGLKGLNDGSFNVELYLRATSIPFLTSNPMAAQSSPLCSRRRAVSPLGTRRDEICSNVTGLI